MPAASGDDAQQAVGLIFSKDRAMQLDCTLRSFFMHSKGQERLRMKVLYKTSNALHENQYLGLQKTYPTVEFIAESHFKNDLQSALNGFQFVLFLVDDSIFIGQFLIGEMKEGLDRNPSALGFSLRLGKNTTYCYMAGKPQTLPSFELQSRGILKFKWIGGELDFAYPLELSSSMYRIADIKPLLEHLDFKNPNTLEALIDPNKSAFTSTHADLLCFEQSVAFSNPVNMVQTVWANRTGRNDSYTTEKLAGLFERGYRIKADRFSGFVPNSCHQEVDFEFVQPDACRVTG